MKSKRRNFLQIAGAASFGLLATGPTALLARQKSPRLIAGLQPILRKGMFFKISLAEWSLHKTIFDGKLDHLDFAKQTRELGIDAVEYVNQFFKDKAEDTAYLDQMNQRAEEHNVKQLLIMIDGEGALGDLDDAKRKEAVENHYKWVHAAKHLGCHSIRVNAYGEGTAEEVGEAAIDGLGRLSEYAAKEEINVIVENHGGYSSNGAWLANIMSQVDMDNCGTLPDFGNFCLKYEGGKQWAANCDEEYDKYLGVEEMMPYAKAVSAKSNDFDLKNNEVNIDYRKMLEIVKKYNYKGYIGIEYEGSTLSEIEGIKATKKLLKSTARKMSMQNINPSPKKPAKKKVDSSAPSKKKNAKM